MGWGAGHRDGSSVDLRAGVRLRRRGKGKGLTDTGWAAAGVRLTVALPAGHAAQSPAAGKPVAVWPSSVLFPASPPARHSPRRPQGSGGHTLILLHTGVYSWNSRFRLRFHNLQVRVVLKIKVHKLRNRSASPKKGPGNLGTCGRIRPPRITCVPVTCMCGQQGVVPTCARACCCRHMCAGVCWLVSEHAHLPMETGHRSKVRAWQPGSTPPVPPSTPRGGQWYSLRVSRSK